MECPLLVADRKRSPAASLAGQISLFLTVAARGGRHTPSLLTRSIWPARQQKLILFLT